MRFEATVRVIVDMPVSFESDDEEMARAMLRAFARRALCFEGVEPTLRLWLGDKAALGRVSKRHELASITRKE